MRAAYILILLAALAATFCGAAARRPLQSYLCTPAPALQCDAVGGTGVGEHWRRCRSQAAAAAAAQHRRKSERVCLAAFCLQCPPAASASAAWCQTPTLRREVRRVLKWSGCPAVQPAVAYRGCQPLNLLLFQLQSLLPFHRCRGVWPAGVFCLPLRLLLLARSGEEIEAPSSPLHCCLPQSHLQVVQLRPCSPASAALSAQRVSHACADRLPG